MHTPSTCTLIAWLIFSGYAFAQDLRFSESDVPQGVKWSKAINGLALGLLPPGRPFIFAPRENWNGKLFIRTKERGIGKTSNPGGEWKQGASFTVLIANRSSRVLYWCNSWRVWSLSFTSEKLKGLGEWPGSIPFPGYPDPIAIKPKQVMKLTYPLALNGHIWPLVREGEYRARLTYDSRDLPRYSAGNTRPFGFPDFWVGRIQTPEIKVKVENAP